MNLFQVYISNFPVLTSFDEKPNYTNKLAFRIILPRDYPAQVNYIKVSFDTIPWHPNVNPNSGILGNYLFGGEISSVLWDAIQLLLFDKERLLPSIDYIKAVDFAINKQAMDWYIKQDHKQFYLENIKKFKNLLLSYEEK